MRLWNQNPRQDNEYRQVITPFSLIWGYRAPVTIGLIAVNAAIWFIMVATDSLGLLPIDKWWFQYFAMTPEGVIHRFLVYQIVTNVFLHDTTSILHLFFNMYFLWVFGPRVERRFSSRTFLVFYFVCGVSGSILSLVMRALMGDWTMPSIGASAAIFGVLVAYGFLFANDILLLFFVIPIKAWKTVLALVIIEVVFIIVTLLGIDLGVLSQIDHWAHLGGSAAAAVWMLVMARRTQHITGIGWTQDGIVVELPHPERTRGPRRVRILIGRRRPPMKDHPEGSDNEPPPDWFKL